MSKPSEAAARWAEIVRGHAASGLSVAACCRREDLVADLGRDVRGEVRAPLAFLVDLIPRALIADCRHQPAGRRLVLERDGDLAAQTATGPAASPLPDRIDKFEILGLLGTGGMGVVYHARQERPARTVALKLIRPDLATPASRRRFQTEMETLARLRHPGIAAIYEAGTQTAAVGCSRVFADRSCRRPARSPRRS
jgi:hypothetical protein